MFYQLSCIFWDPRSLFLMMGGNSVSSLTIKVTLLAFANTSEISLLVKEEKNIQYKLLQYKPEKQILWFLNFLIALTQPGAIFLTLISYTKTF